MKNKPLVMVVDDEEDIRLNLEAALNANGYETTSAETGLEALEAVAERRPDLIILDIMMPDIDGYEVCRRLKENESTRHIAIVFASALKKAQNRIEGLDMGADDYLTKPYNMDEMLAKLRSLFRVQEYQRRLERLVAFSHAINKLDRAAIASAITEHILSVLPTDRYSIFCLDENGSQLKLLTHNHLPTDIEDLPLRPEESPLMQQTLRTGERLFVADFPTSNYTTGHGEQGKHEDGYALCIPLKAGPDILAVMNLTGNSNGFFNRNEFHYAELVAEMIAASLNNARLLEEQKKLATTDGLTKLTNHRHFHEILAAEFERAGRYSQKLSCIIIDIDHFKAVNDTYGHLVGDEVLKEVAIRLGAELRVVDSVARYGGEEFALLLPESSAKAAHQVAERIRERIRSIPFETEKGPLNITISLGICDSTTEGLKSGIDLVNKADQALYAAKDSGRDKTVTYAELQNIV